MYVIIMSQKRFKVNLRSIVCLNVKELLAPSRRIRTRNHLVRKRTLNHLNAKWLSVPLRIKWLWVRNPVIVKYIMQYLKK